MCSWVALSTISSDAIIFLSIKKHKKRNCKIVIWWRHNYRTFVQSLRSYSLTVYAEWADKTDEGTGRGQRMNSRKADRQRGRGVQVAWLLLRSILTLTMEPLPVTRIALSSTVYCSFSLSLSPRCLFPFLTVSLSRSSCLFLFFSHPLSLHLLVANVACCLWQPKCTTTSLLQLTPLLPHVCSFSRQAGLKSQLRIEPSRLKPVSNQPSPPPSPLPNPRLASCWL